VSLPEEQLERQPTASVAAETAAANLSDSGGIPNWLLVVFFGLVLVAFLGGVFTAGGKDGHEHPKEDRRLVDFSLTDTAGRSVSRSDLEGKYAVVSFVFTSCSLSCIQVVKTMAEIQRRTADQKDVVLVSLSLDPRTDTPAVLGSFARRYGAESARWHFLTGEKQTVYELIERSFLEKSEQPDTGPNAIPGGFERATRIALVDSRGVVRAFFDGMGAGAPAAVMKELEELRQSTKHE